MQIRFTVDTKCDKYYYKILTILLQRATSTTLLQSATIIKVRQIKALKKKYRERMALQNFKNKSAVKSSKFNLFQK